jgi:hypothetical protein
MLRILRYFPVYFQWLSVAVGDSTQHTRDMESDPLARAQARIALHMAERQLAGRRDLRAEVRYTMIAKYVAARRDKFPESLDDGSHTGASKQTSANSLAPKSKL